MRMPYAADIEQAIKSPKGSKAILLLMTVFEEFDIPVTGVRLEVKVPPNRAREYIGKMFGNVDVEVST